MAGYYNSQADRRHASLAQLDRASGYGPEGQGFEFSTARQKEIPDFQVSLFYFHTK